MPRGLAISGEAIAVLRSSDRMSGTSPNIDPLLAQVRAGDEAARKELFSQLYSELKGLAKRQLAKLDHGSSMRATELLHEAWIRLSPRDGASTTDFQSQFHFCCTAAKAMRSILVDHARERFAEKRGGGRAVLSLDQTGALSTLDHPAAGALDLLAFDSVLERLMAADAELGELIELRYFAGLGNEEIAKLRGLSLATVERRFAVARAFLHREQSKDDSPKGRS